MTGVLIIVTVTINLCYSLRYHIFLSSLMSALKAFDTYTSDNSKIQKKKERKKKKLRANNLKC
jgi:hypothetical protein